MANPSAEKLAVVAEVSEKLAGAQAAIVTEYRGMTVGSLAELRRALRPLGAEYKVYKNTLARFAAHASGYGDLEQFLKGPAAITFISADASAVAKVLRDHAKRNPALVLVGGVVSGKAVNAAELKALADLPPREVLLAQFAGLLQAPLAKTARALAALPNKAAYGLKALIDQREAA